MDEQVGECAAGGPLTGRRALVSALFFAVMVVGVVLALSSGSPAAADGLLTGTVRNAGSNPVPAIDVTVYDPVWGIQLAATTTAADGTYSVSLPAGSYRMMFRDPTHAYADRFSGGPTGTSSWAGSGLVAVADPTGGVQDAVLVANPSIAGTVTKPGGAAAAGIYVEARATTGAVIAHASTDANGAFTMVGLAPDTYLVRYTDFSGQLATTYHPGVNVASAATPFVLGPGDAGTADQQLVAAGSVGGTVRMASMPRPNVLVIAFDSTSTDPVSIAVSDVNGAYTVRGLAPGSYKVAWIDLAYLSDPSHSLRPRLAPAVDVLSQSVSTAFAAAGSYAVSAGATASIPSGQLVGAACDPTLYTLGANRSHSDLTGADLRACNLGGINLSASTFTGADLTAARISVANLSSSVGLTGAQLTVTDHDWWLTNLSGTGVDLHGVDFASGGYALLGANLTGANLSGATFTGIDLTSLKVPNTNLSGANLTYTALTSADLSGANLTGATLDSWFTGANLTGAHIAGATFVGALDLTKAQLTSTDHDWTGTVLISLVSGGVLSVDLSGVDFAAGAYTLTGSTLWANLSGAQFDGMTLTNVAFTYLVNSADLSSADLSGATLTGCNLKAANLAGANLTNATIAPSTAMTSPSFSGANLTGTVITGVDLTYAAGLTSAQLLATAHDWTATTLPLTTSFAGVDFRGLGLNLTNSVFRDVDLTGANLSGLTLHGTVFDTATLNSATFAGATLSGVSFVQATGTSMNLSGAHVASSTLAWAQLPGANLANAVFTGSSLYGTVISNGWAPNLNIAGSSAQYLNVRYANVQGANFTGTNLFGAYFEYSWVLGASFTNAGIGGIKVKATNDLTKAQLLSAAKSWLYISFDGYDLSGIDFTGQGIALTYASITNTNLTGTNLAGRNLTGVKLSGSNLANATFLGATGPPMGGSTATYSATTCPDGVIAPTGAATCVGHGFTA